MSQSEDRSMRKISYPTPGEILLEEFLKPMGISAYRLAKDALAGALAKIKPLKPA